MAHKMVSRLKLLVIPFFWFLTQGFEVNKPSALTEEQEKRFRSKQLSKGKSVDGFTVQLRFTFEKEEAHSIKKRFLDEFEHAFIAEVIWHEPHFKVYAGAFHTRAEALALLYKARSSFPNAMIVRTQI